MFDGKLKAVTFSYDDGVLQDERLIQIFNKYNLKATFNLNSELLGKDGHLTIEDKWINHTKVQPRDVKALYCGHEVAVHTLTHPRLPALEELDIIRQVEQDRINLSELVNYEVKGMAYPCGGVNNDDRVAAIIKANTGVKYARTIAANFSFDLQDNLYRFNPTIHHVSFEKLFECGEEFINMKADRPQIYYIWGHSYEFDVDDSWDKFEEFCKMISGREDIFYGTNAEVLGFSMRMKEEL